ncbi:colicin E3/pyocin S6 family cytotoxin [Pseudomonas citronellolis]|uniref:colicin E3/pyocin S6 family cytotoxin n=1 Tax=Pseudomonas citronellolis TaxID=53408 RepID=UPI002FDB760D
MAAVSVAAASGMVKDSSLSKMNGRDVYKEKNGYLFALDTQHGRFEMVNPKNGRHLGEFDFDFNKTKPADKNGSHDLKMR